MRYALRKLYRAPLFTAAVVATLGIAVGANSTIFSVVDAVLIQPLPYEDSDRLVSLEYTMPGFDVDSVPQSAALHNTLLEESQSFETVGMWEEASVSITGATGPAEVRALRVTHTLFPLFRLQPIAGRIFGDRDELPGAPRTVLLGNAFWRSRFGGSPDVLGQPLRIDGERYEIIGIMGPDLQILDHDPSVYLPFGDQRQTNAPWVFGYQAAGRLRPGFTLEQAAGEIERMLPLAIERYPGGVSRSMLEQARFAPRLQPLKEAVVGDIRRILWLLFGSVGMVLVIACANVANLFVVRSQSRRSDAALRTALGATRSTIAREVLAESMTLGLIGGAAGSLIAYAAIRLVKWVAPSGLPRLDEVVISPVVLLFTLGLSLAAGLLFGLLSLLHRGSDPLTALRSDRGPPAGMTPGHLRTRDLLVMSQLAFVVVLFIAAGLMIRSLLALREVDPGFAAVEEVVTATVRVQESEIADPERVALAYEQMVTELRAIPGVQSASGTNYLPMDGVMGVNPILVEGSSSETMPPFRWHKAVLPHYFETMEQTVVTGRPFNWSDIHERAPVAVISENLAQEYWGSAEEAIGKRFRYPGRDEVWRVIVGVVGDVHDDGLSAAPPTLVYWPALSPSFRGEDLWVARSMTFTVRTARTANEALIADMRSAIGRVNSSIPLSNVRVMQEVVDASIARTSFTVVMLVLGSVAALLLGGVGVYAVAAFTVSQRRREIGVRIALGAKGRQIARLILGRALILSVIGTATGCVIALSMSSIVSSLLYGVEPTDPATFVIVCTGLIGTCLLASYLPAQKAARIDPMAVLRS